jgi:hypothetical protein
MENNLYGVVDDSHVQDYHCGSTVLRSVLHPCCIAKDSCRSSADIIHCILGIFTDIGEPVRPPRMAMNCSPHNADDLEPTQTLCEVH